MIKIEKAVKTLTKLFFRIDNKKLQKDFQNEKFLNDMSFEIHSRK